MVYRISPKDHLGVRFPPALQRKLELKRKHRNLNMDKLPLEISRWRNALSSCATISMLRESTNLPSRNSEAQFTAYVHSVGSFSIDYLDFNKQGKMIIKSDLFSIIKYKGDDYYRPVKKSQYPHHHIDKDLEMWKRVESVISIEVPDIVA